MAIPFIGLVSLIPNFANFAKTLNILFLLQTERDKVRQSSLGGSALKKAGGWSWWALSERQQLSKI
jgi:hypothetical protein